MHVGFSFCLNFNIVTRFLYNRTDFFLRTQAFASPTDMASSSVRENVNLNTHFWWCMWNVILHNFGFDFYCKFECMSIFLNIFQTNLLWVGVTDVIVTVLNQWKFLADVLFHMLCNGWCCCHCGIYICHYIYMWKMAPHSIICLWQML